MRCGNSAPTSLRADALGHEVIGPDGEARAAVLAEFGETDRAKLAAMVFGKPDRLAKLNAIVHPAVRARAGRMIDEISGRDPHAVVVYVAAILIESGGLDDARKLIVVTCTREQQIARALERPGATEASVMARLEHQMPMAEKVARANYMIDASGTKQDTLRQTKLVFEELRDIAA